MADPIGLRGFQVLWNEEVEACGLILDAEGDRMSPVSGWAEFWL